ncbi:MAG TPA: cell division protein FtsA, partial [Anaerolineales bacterium]|nr:cell division protein FtsA [Anaerolineales bacterium]
QGLRLPQSEAEKIKLQHGHALTSVIGEDEYFLVRAFGEDKPVRVSRRDLVHIINARVDEIFELVVHEIKRSGYDGLLPAGIVLTGGSSALPGIRKLANQVLNVPVRIAQPEDLSGMVDRLQAPAYATSVGLLKWASLMNEFVQVPTSSRRGATRPLSQWDWSSIRNFLRRLLP